MRGLVPILLLAALAPAAPATAQERPPLRAELLRCRTGDTAATRAATFRAGMPTARGTRRMAMHFQLRERRSRTGDFRPVRVPSWAGWVRAERGAPGFVFTRRIDRLRPGRAYRALVIFRWYDADGDVRRQARRLTELCSQPAAD